MKVCKGWPRYKGILKPRCNRGRGCDACRKKYETGPLRKGQIVEDTWFSYKWGRGQVIRVGPKKILIDFTSAGPMKFDLAHVRSFIRKVL